MAQPSEIDWAEYANGSSVPTPPSPASAVPQREIPWQIWVVVVLLGLEGLSNLLMIPQYPIALYWLSVKCLLITGLLKGWRWVFVLFLVVAAMHVLGFLGTNPIASLANLILMVLTISARPYYFRPSAAPDGDSDPTALLEQRVAELEGQLRAMEQT